MTDDDILREIRHQLYIGNLIAYASHRNEHTDALGGSEFVSDGLRRVLANADLRIREGLGL